MDKQIDVRDDNDIVLCRLSNAANNVYQVRLRIAGNNCYKRPSSEHSKPRDAEHFASNLYEKSFTFMSVMVDLSTHTNSLKHLMHGGKLEPREIQR